MLTTKTILDTMKKLDYPVFKGDYNLNLVGVRSSNTDANTFNDVMVVLYQVNGKQHMHTFPMTTDPGVYYRKNPVNINGTAVLVPGHYPSCWKIGAHKSKYYALVQSCDMTVWRDNDGDEKLDEKERMETGVFGINCHHAGANTASLYVDKWSAGCQVLADPVDFELLMALVKKSAQKYGASFSYTLLNEDQF